MSRKIVAALIFRKGKMLLVKNVKHGKPRIEPPGGKVLPKEGVEIALKREVKEELGIEIKPLRLFGVYPTTTPEGNFDVWTFLAEIVSGEPRIPEKERGKLEGFGWFGLNEIIGNQFLVPNLRPVTEELKKFCK